MHATVDLKHVGLIVSAGAAVTLRCFSDFGFATIQQNAMVAGLDVSQATFPAFVALYLNAMVDELQRDWFNISPQTPPQVVAILVGLVLTYAALRRALPPQPAALVVLVGTPLLPFVATAAACAWIVVRTARAG